MAYAVISDVHSNLEALHSVLRDIHEKGISEIFFLGDAVGYGPEPDACIDLLRKECRVLLAGNHDWGACGLTDISFFNLYARTAIEWTKEALAPEKIDILGSFPVILKVPEKNLTLVHSTPYEPERWHYLLTLSDAEFNFRYFNTSLCFIGHSHSPFIIERLPSGELLKYNETAQIRHGNRYIVNAGSVGQPRDRNPRAGYAVVDNEKVDIIRVPYDIEATQRKMRLARLPVPLIERLSFGM